MGETYDPTVIRNKNIPDAKIVNVVAKYRLVYEDEFGRLFPISLNIAKLTKYVRSLPFKYNPNSFAAALIKVFSSDLPDKITTALIFETGSVIHTGGRTEAELFVGAHQLVVLLTQLLGIPLTMMNFRVTNIVCKMQTGFFVDLEELTDHLGHRAKYKPNGPGGFPSARIKGLTNPREAGLVFLSGATILSGAKKRSYAEANHRLLYAICQQHMATEKTKLTPQEYRGVGRKRSRKQLMEKIQKNKQLPSSDSLQMLEYLVNELKTITFPEEDETQKWIEYETLKLGIDDDDDDDDDDEMPIRKKKRNVVEIQ